MQSPYCPKHLVVQNSPYQSSFITGGWVKAITGEYKLFNIDFRGICTAENGCTWEQSKIVCQLEGGYLAKITSQAENDVITKIINRANTPTMAKFYFHIGLNDRAEEGKHRWVSDLSLIHI